jgi:hypothetical protein
VTKRDRERFWAKVRVDRETGCWIWTASVRTWKREPWDGGFGAFKLYGKVERAHKVAYRILFGCWPPRGLVLRHGCDNRRCVNVLAHIEPGTQKQNVDDMIARGRSIQQRRKATILQGDENGQPATSERQGKSVRSNRLVEAGFDAVGGWTRNDQFYPWQDGTAQ